jgi:hypothetical protein
MEGSVLSFLKVEWNVSDTGSADWASGYRGEDSLEINQSETIIASGGHVC